MRKQVVFSAMWVLLKEIRDDGNKDDNLGDLLSDWSPLLCDDERSADPVHTALFHKKWNSMYPEGANPTAEEARQF